MFRFLHPLSPGERRLIGTHLSMGLVSAVVAYRALLQLEGGHGSAGMLTPYQLWVVVSGFVAGVAALSIMRDRLGRQGLAGIAEGAAAAVAATILAGLIGGTLALPLWGTMFGPFTLIVTLAASPMLAILWGAIFVAAHLQTMVWQRERDSLLNWTPGPRA